MWNKKNGKKNYLNPLQAQGILNEIKDTLGEFKELIKRSGGKDLIHVQDLTKPTHQVVPVTAPQPTTNYATHTAPIKRDDAKPPSTYETFRQRIKDCKQIKEILEVMADLKAEPMLPRDKMSLEAYAKEISRDMPTD